MAVRIEGALAENPLECPSHVVAISAAKNSKSIVLAGGSAIMDRDFVLQLKMANDTQVESFYARDEDNYVALASFKPVFNADIAQASRCIKLVVDCSGSMAGDSIYQAKSALREIFLLLKSKDYFNLMTFGNSSQTLFPTVMPASTENLAIAARYVEQIDANMGGTELASALNEAFLSGSIEGTPSDVMLITDGEVWNQEELLSSAEKAGHRIFTVGVGSAVSEAILKNLADRTNGACELVSPNENMAQHIVRHYLRINQPKAKSMDLSWPSPTINQAPSEFTTVYAGDTIHVFGWLAERPKGVVKMTMTLENGQVFSQESELIEAAESGDSLNNNLPRLGIYNLLESRAYIEKVDTDEIANMAEKYQLITEHTNCVLVYERDETEKSLNIPAVRKVPQVTAAGGQGFGTVKARRVQVLERCVNYDSNFDVPTFLRGCSHDTQHKITRDLKQAPKDTDVVKHAYAQTTETDNYSILVTRVNEKYPSDLSKQLDIEMIADLVALGLGEREAVFLSGFTGLIQENEIVLCFLSALARSRYKQSFSKQARRVIERANSENGAPSDIVESIEEYLDTSAITL